MIEVIQSPYRGRVEVGSLVPGDFFCFGDAAFVLTHKRGSEQYDAFRFCEDRDARITTFDSEELVRHLLPEDFRLRLEILR